MQAEKAAEEEAAEAKAAAKGPAPPPTALLGYAPSPNGATSKPATGKYSWTPGFFDSRKKSAAAALQITASSSSMDEPQSSGHCLDNAVAASGNQSPAKHVTAGRVAAEGKDYGDVWRDAAEHKSEPSSGRCCWLPLPHSLRLTSQAFGGLNRDARELLWLDCSDSLGTLCYTLARGVPAISSKAPCSATLQQC